MSTKVRMDEYGSVLLPREMRESLELKPRDKIDIEVVEDVIILRPMYPEDPIVRAIKDSREERTRSILGLE